MQSRSERMLVSLAFTVLLALALSSGCGLFDPEPTTRNRPPRTEILDVAAEPTKTPPIRHHVYWSGTDDDGEVVRFIFAITDSLLDDLAPPDENELDRIFDPADDPSTLEPTDWRTIGITTRTDSVFLFQPDPKSEPTQGVSFHLVAQDDDAAIDPSPVRIHFFNNALGRPVLKFKLSTYEDVGGGAFEWVARWIGTPDGPSPGESPELTQAPHVGFGRRFRIDWEASSPNGVILGYRFKAEEHEPSYIPSVDEDGEKQWDLSLRNFEYANDVPPQDLPGCDVDESTGQLLDSAICPANAVRWPSDDYFLSVQAIDIARMESRAAEGVLRFRVNYAPETEIVDDDTWPLYRIFDGQGGFDEFPITPPDTVPVGSQVVFNVVGYDKTEDLVAPATHGELCCDTILDTAALEFQARYDAELDKGSFTTNLTTAFSEPFEGDPATIAFEVGPFAYEFQAVARDEHGRVDETPATYEFVAGLRPQLLSTLPATGDRVVFTNLNSMPWPGSLPYATTAAARYWSGEDWVTDPSLCPPGTCMTEVPGILYQFLAHFEGRGHPKEPTTRIRAWQFRHVTENDPLNRVTDGRETKDFSTWIGTPTPGNQWSWDENRDEAIEVFVPSLFWAVPSIYEPDSELPDERAQGKWMARRLGSATLTLRARTTTYGDTWPFYNRVTEDPASVIHISIEDAGRRSKFLDIDWSLWLGIDTDGDDLPDRLWPDFQFSDYDG